MKSDTSPYLFTSIKTGIKPFTNLLLPPIDY